MGENILTTDNLTKEYREVTANKNISVQIERGKIVGLIGRNGSGKTTFLRMVTGLVKPTSGSVDKKYVNVGAIVEAPAFFKGMSGIRNMYYHAKLIGASKEDALITLKKCGLNPDDKKRVGNYSLEVKQRLGIALALLSKPEMLILDEPTNGLDPEGIIELRAFLKELSHKENMTILVSSHILSELAQIADSFVIINNGMLVETLTAEDLQNKIKKHIIVKTEDENAANVLEKLKNDGVIEDFKAGESEFIIYEPNDVNVLIKAIAELDVIDIMSKNDTLETYYLDKVGGAV